MLVNWRMVVNKILHKSVAGNLSTFYLSVASFVVISGFYFNIVKSTSYRSIVLIRVK